jgi:hypothetical protein
MNPYKYVRKWVHKHVWRHEQWQDYDDWLDWHYTGCSCGWWFN